MDSDLGFNKYDICLLINLLVHERGVGPVRTYGEARELLRDRDKLKQLQLLLLLLLRPVTGVVPPKRERATDLDEPWFSNEEFGISSISLIKLRAVARLDAKYNTKGAWTSSHEGR
ncbi:hypothetical protein Peur_023048 [Populus x canadensis]